MYLFVKTADNYCSHRCMPPRRLAPVQNNKNNTKQKSRAIALSARARARKMFHFIKRSPVAAAHRII